MFKCKYIIAERLVIETGNTSTHFLMANLYCTYNTAVEILIELEKNGIVTKASDGWKREVICKDLNKGE